MAKLTRSEKESLSRAHGEGEGRKPPGRTRSRKKRLPARPRKKPQSKNEPRRRRPARPRRKARTDRNFSGAAKVAFLNRMAKGRKAAGKNPKKKTAKKRRNSSVEEASALYEQFHQKAPGSIREYELP